MLRNHGSKPKKIILDNAVLKLANCQWKWPSGEGPQGIYHQFSVLIENIVTFWKLSIKWQETSECTLEKHTVKWHGEISIIQNISFPSHYYQLFVCSFFNNTIVWLNELGYFTKKIVNIRNFTTFRSCPKIIRCISKESTIFN